MQVFPADEILIEDSLNALVSSGRLHVFDSDQGELLQVANWGKHQKISRPTPTRFTGITPKLGANSVSPHGVFTESSALKGKERKGKERKGDDDFPIGQSSSATDPVDNSGLFDLEVFRSIRPDLDRLSDDTIRQLAIETVRKSKKSVGNETNYVLRAAKDPTWVKRGDEIEWDALVSEGGAA